MVMSQGKVITCRAAVCWNAGEKLKIEKIQVEPPSKNEVRVKIMTTSLCFSDVSGAEGKFEKLYPIVLGHEGTGIVESVGEGVTEFAAGDTVIPLFMPQCKKCSVCRHKTANVCLEFAKGFKGFMADGTTRMSCNGQPIYHFVGCSTFSEYAVIDVVHLCKINPEAPLDKVCIYSCGFLTGYGSVFNNSQVEKGSSCAVWGIGTIGLAVIMGCKAAGADKIIAIDINPSKFNIAKEFGATEVINPRDLTVPTDQHLMVTYGGIDHTFECIGSIQTMKEAFGATSFGYGTCVLLGVTPSGQELGVLPMHCQLGRSLKGSFFGGYKSKDSVPQLVQQYMDGELATDKIITHNLTLVDINKAFDLLKNGLSLRTVIHHEHE
ncbi:Alcohol dehydrogenase class-3 chain L [Pseudolycoriella hygida]|uniref:Alcohol dehydrogenase class-3 chain L n=1 Tax=Pseudolycoriella hygida TaxID=35572 RepID=A0A9Q0NGM3_9DIPT|nr:Alcohol dehydrogenase class-3 chain L [Pseudolycoriella hygida]